MDILHNFFFYPNVCHICKQFGREISLKRCGNCRMISYCSKEHQREHWPQHKELCNAICNVLTNNILSSFLNNEQNINMEKWVEFKMNFMLMVALQIGRRLVHYEEEMFKFLRSCNICHEQDAKVLQDCPNCPNASFCAKHKGEGTHSVCYLTKLCFDLDMMAVTYMRSIPRIKVPCHINYVDLPENINDFINSYILSEAGAEISQEKNAIISSEYLTRPLTFLYVIRKLRYILKDNSITIHIIGANMIDTVGMILWEILLHWLPCIATVKLLFVGPELSSDFSSLNLCKDCKDNSKQLSVHMLDTLYETYVQRNLYAKPNFIVAYNPGMHEFDECEFEQDTWAQCVHAIAKQNCPFILTSYTLLEAERESMILNKILGGQIKYACFEKNPYASVKPYRDFETEGIYYQNQYIIIYEDFKV